MPEKRAIFCLVANDDGQVLFVQRAHGNRKGKWSLPGEHVDRGERSFRAAIRETKEETGLDVWVTHRLFTGNRHPVRVYVAKPVVGRLQRQRRECVDVRWRDPKTVESWELAFGGDRKALRLWADMQDGKYRPEASYE